MLYTYINRHAGTPGKNNVDRWNKPVSGALRTYARGLRLRRDACMLRLVDRGARSAILRFGTTVVTTEGTVAIGLYGALGTSILYLPPVSSNIMKNIYWYFRINCIV